MELFFPILLLIFGVMLALQFRAQKKRVDEMRATQASVKAGDRVVLTSGIHGVVVSVDSERIGLDIADGVVVAVEKAAIHRLLHNVDTSGELLESSETVDDTADKAVENGNDASIFTDDTSRLTPSRETPQHDER